MGIFIITLLVLQLHGTITVDRESGTDISINRRRYYG